jgi:DNA repair protein SbcC/Rad50
MIPVQLTLRNFLSYCSATLDFRGLQTACVCGANGAGKSSLLEGMSWAIWGRSRVENEDDVIHQGQQEAHVEFIFQIHQNLYRIIRTRCRRQGMALEFQVATEFDPTLKTLPKRFRPITEKGVRATQLLILQQVRLDYDTFVNSAYLRQGRADEFMLKRPIDRKQILADLLKLDRYDDLAEKAKEETRNAKAQVDAIDRQRAAIVSQLEGLKNLEPQQEQLEVTIAQLQTQQTVALSQSQTLKEQQQQQQTWQTQFQWQQTQQQQQKQDCDRLTQEYHQAEQHMQQILLLLHQEDAICSGYVRWQQLQAEEEFLGDRAYHYQQLQTQRHQYQQQQRDRIHLLQQQQRQLETQEHNLLEQFDETQQVLSSRSDIESAIEKLRIAKQDLKRFDSVQLKAAPLLQRRQQIQRDLDRAVAKITTQLDTLRTSVQQFEKQQSGQPDLQRAIVQVGDRVEELEKLRRYQERVRDKGLERRTFMERLQTRQRDYEVQLADVNQILSLLKHQSADADLNAKLREVLAKHHAELSREMQAESGGGVAVRESVKPYIVQTYPIQPEVNPRTNGEFPPCPLCDRPLDEHHWSVVVEKHLSEQQEILDEIWIIREQLSVSEREIQVLRQEYKELEVKLNEYGSILERRGQLQEQLQAGVGVRSQLETLTQDVAQIESQLLDQRYAPDLQEELRLIDQTLMELDYDDRNHAIARGAVERWRWADIKYVAIQQAHARQQQLEAKLSDVQAELVAIETQIKTLQTELQSGLAEFDEALVALGYNLEQHNTLRSQLKTAQLWQLRYQDFLQAHQQLPALQIRLDQLAHSLQSRLINLETVNRDCQQLQTYLVETRDTPQDLQQLETQIQQERQQLDRALSSLGRIQQQRQHQQYLQQDLGKLDRDLVQAQQQYRIYQELTQAFGKNGIQALLIENVLPQLETLTNQILARLTNNQLQAQFITQRRTGKNKAIPKYAETLDILIADAHSTRPYETYSGGEAFRINFAIRLALARLLSQRSGTALQMLIVDEGFGTQDQEGCDRLIAAINAISADFACILTVTHMPYFRDAFQSRIEVTKTAQGSKISLWT